MKSEKDLFTRADPEKIALLKGSYVNKMVKHISREESLRQAFVTSLGSSSRHQARYPIARFEMSPALPLPQSGSGYADVYFLYWVRGDALDNLTPLEDSRPIRVVDSMRMHSKMATESPDVGAYGLARVPPDAMVDDPYQAVWEIITMQTPGIFTGRVQSELTKNTASIIARAFRTDEAAGHITHEGYDPFGAGWAAANGGELDITVYNPPAVWNGSSFDEYLFESPDDGVVWCRWDMRESRYYIFQAECPLDEQESFLMGHFYI